MMLIEYGDAAIAVDCGLMFPGAEILGVDLAIPDITYLLENRHKLKAIVLTHAHEDHVGALPYVLRQLAVPIFGTRLTLAMLANRLREHDLEDSADVREVTAGAPWEISPFKLEGIRPAISKSTIRRWKARCSIFSVLRLTVNKACSCSCPIQPTSSAPATRLLNAP
jgi:ribonuclease J